MAMNSDQMGGPQQIFVQCPCGKRLAIPLRLAGKRLKCRFCGQKVNAAIESATPPKQNLLLPIVAPNPRMTVRMTQPPPIIRQTTQISLWSGVGVFAIGCVFFVVWLLRSSQQAQIEAANHRIALATTTAKDWLQGQNPTMDFTSDARAVATASQWQNGNPRNNNISLIEAEAAEQKLAEALTSEVATEKTDGQAVLAQLRQRRNQLAKHVRDVGFQHQAKVAFQETRKRLRREIEATDEQSGVLASINEHPPFIVDCVRADLKVWILFGHSTNEFQTADLYVVLLEGKVTHYAARSIYEGGVKQDKGKISWEVKPCVTKRELEHVEIRKLVHSGNIMEDGTIELLGIINLPGIGIVDVVSNVKTLIVPRGNDCSWQYSTLIRKTFNKDLILKGVLERAKGTTEDSRDESNGTGIMLSLANLGTERARLNPAENGNK